MTTARHWASACSVIISICALLWFFRIEIVPRPDGSTLHYNRLTGAMQICSREQRCTNARNDEAALAEKTKADPLFIKSLNDAAAQIAQERQAISELVRSKKSLSEKAIDVPLSFGLGFIRPWFESWDSLVGPVYYEDKSAIRIGAEQALVELSRQSGWNRTAGLIGSALAILFTAFVIAVATWKLLRWIFPNFLRRLFNRPARET
jgi:hypothetical protein